MPFIQELKKYKSISIIGLEKNVGKTETLNYVIDKLKKDTKIGITSIGVDGETTDVVTNTPKPEIVCHEEMLFVTSEKFYKQKKLQGEVLSVSERGTFLGRIIIGRVLREGKIIISGPTTGVWLKEVMNELEEKGVDIIIIDGALSRMSIGSPIITEGLILATGASVSLNLKELIKKTNHIVNLIKIKIVEEKLQEELKKINSGVYKIDFEGKIKKLPIDSLLNFYKLKENIFSEKCKIFITGAITEKFLENMCKQKFLKNIEFIVTDFTKLFITPETYDKFLKKGGDLKVLYKTNLIAITINPISPTGYSLDSKELIKELKETIDIPVVNLREVENER